MKEQSTRYVLISGIKGIMHSMVIPFCLLWGFGKYGNIKLAIATPISYVILVGIMYYFSSNKKLSGAMFFGILKALFVFLLMFGVVLGVMFTL